MDPCVPILWHLAEIQTRLANRLQKLGYLIADTDQTLAMGQRHLEVDIPVGINGELRDVEFLVSQYALDGSADLPFIEHEGLRTRVRLAPRLNTVDVLLTAKIIVVLRIP